MHPRPVLDEAPVDLHVILSADAVAIHEGIAAEPRSRSELDGAADLLALLFLAHDVPCAGRRPSCGRQLLLPSLRPEHHEPPEVVAGPGLEPGAEAYETPEPTWTPRVGCPGHSLPIPRDERQVSLVGQSLVRPGKSLPRYPGPVQQINVPWTREPNTLTLRVKRPRHALPVLAQPCRALPDPALPCPGTPHHAMPNLAQPRLALARLASPGLAPPSPDHQRTTTWPTPVMPRACATSKYKSMIRPVPQAHQSTSFTRTPSTDTMLFRQPGPIACRSAGPAAA